MDQVSIMLTTALVAGATTVANAIANVEIKEAYARLKSLIIARYQKAQPFVEALEADPSSDLEQKMLTKQLSQAGAGADLDLKKSAQQLLSVVEGLRREPKAAALFDFDLLRAARNFELEDIQTIGTILRAREAHLEDFKAVGIRQIQQGAAEKK